MRSLIITALLPFLALSSSHREHKVHNIVLYPHMQSRCKTMPIKQVVGEPGYESTTVENSVCVGTCFSYSIPHTTDITITPYCDSCQPSETHWFHVTLQKLANADEELSEYPNQDVSTPLPDTIQKQIQIITNCTCLSCTEQFNSQKNIVHENTTEIPKSLLVNNKKDKEKPVDTRIWDEIEEEQESREAFKNSVRYVSNENSDGTTDSNEDSQGSTKTRPKSPPFEIPELLHLVNRSNSRAKFPHDGNLFIKGSNIDFQNVSAAQRYYLNTKLINLLKNIQNSSQNDSTPTENNFNFDRELLSELLEIIEGSENHLNDQNLMEFVNFVNVHNSEDFELDLSRLKTVLTKYENEKKDELQKTTSTTDAHEHSESIEYAPLKKTDGTVNVHLKKDDNLNVHEENSHDKHKKYHGGKHGHIAGLGKDGGYEKHHHYAGEHINLALDPDMVNHKHLNHLTGVAGIPGGHLVPGPHGSLVIEPDADNVEEKLNMEPHLLRPNHEGTVIHYESHIKDKHKVLGN